MTLIQRVQSPTPNFFKKVRNGGLIFATLSASLLAAPIALPPVLLKIAGYLTVAGGVASAVSQATTDTDGQPKDDHHD
jgi:hypothetical protein